MNLTGFKSMEGSNFGIKSFAFFGVLTILLDCKVTLDIVSSSRISILKTYRISLISFSP